MRRSNLQLCMRLLPEAGCNGLAYLQYQHVSKQQQQCACASLASDGPGKPQCP